MRSLAAAAFFSLPALAQAQSILSVQGMSGQPVTLAADEAVCTNDHCAFLGHVLLVSGRTVLSSNALHIDLATGDDGQRRVSSALATGDVLLIDGNTMTTCERIALNGDLITGALGLAEIRVKKPGSFDAKLSGFDAFGAGRDQLYLSGDITRTGPKSFVVKNAYFTPCDCGKDSRPIFSMKAKEARVELDSHAVFIQPVLQPADVPFPMPFALPALYIPISKRKTGILPPGFRLLSEDGVYFEEAFFVVLGQSADATAAIGVNEQRGLRWSAELRYAPSATTEGGFNYLHMFDTKFLTKERPTSELGAHRINGRFWHRSGTYERFSLRADTQFFSDNTMLGAIQYSVAAQATQYVPSRVAADYRGDGWRVSGGAAIYQDFQAPTFFGPQQGRVVQRLPDLGFSLAPTELFWGVRLSLDARASAGFALRQFQTVAYEMEDGNRNGRLRAPIDGDPPYVQQQITEALRPPGTYLDCATSPTYGLTDDNGAPIVVNDRPIVDAYGAPLRLANACARPLRFVRLDVVPRLSRPFQLGFLRVHPEIFGLAAIGGESVSNSVTPRGFVGLRVDLSTMFGRVFTVSDHLALRHRLRPIVSYLVIPTIFGTPAPYIFDERDQFRAAHQLLFGVETDLFRKVSGGAAERTLTVSLFQQVNLGFDGRAIRDLRATAGLDDRALRTLALPAGFASLVLRAAFDWRPFSIALRGTYDVARREVTEKVLAAKLRIFDGSEVGFSYQNFSEGGSARMNVGLFELVPGGGVVSTGAGALHLASFNAVVRPLKWLELSYGFALGFGDGVVSQRVTVQGQSIRARLVGACDCFGVDVSASFLPEFFTPQMRPPSIDVGITVGDYTFRPQ
ncbi:MAG: hypothetical protein IT381_10795 [Deltaproteobacteria bacterium]|nr:hypothetical protein [Deltaproteobacteria bacterium]